MPKERNIALDRFRGLAIILMVIVNDLGDTAGVPWLLSHAKDTGLTFADMVAPFFLFAIGATFRPSFLRRAAVNKKDAYMHFIVRYLAIFGIGAIFSAGESMIENAVAWNALQSIGIAGLLTLFIVRLPLAARAAAGTALLGAYGVASRLFMSDMVFAVPHGGLLGSFSWAVILILSTVLFELLEKGLPRFLICAAVISFAAAGSLFLVDVSKNRVSASYVLAALAISCALYLLLHLLTKSLPRLKAGLVTWWGENPILFYVLHLVLCGVARAPFLLLHVSPRPVLLALPGNLAILAGMSLLAWQLHKRQIRVSL